MLLKPIFLFCLASPKTFVTKDLMSTDDNTEMMEKKNTKKKYIKTELPF